MSTRQSITIMVAAVLLVSVMGFGLPSIERMQIVNYKGGVGLHFLDDLTTMRPKPFSGDDTPVRISAYEKLITDYRAFVFGSSQYDERHVYSSLSRMRPGQLDFHPGSFLYGGGYTYPVGIVLYMLEATGVLTLTTDLEYYARHPAQAARIYYAGRVLNIAAFIGIMVCMCLIGTRYASERAVWLSLLFFGLAPVSSAMATISKPHLYAAFWVLLGIYWLHLHIDSAKMRWLVLSGAALGFATGSSIVVAPAFAAYPVLLWGNGSLRSVWSKSILAFLCGIVVFFVVNPYVLLDFNGFEQQILSSSGKHGVPVSLQGLLGKWKHFAGQGVELFSLPFVFFACIAIAGSVIVGNGIIRRNAVWIVIALLFMAATANRVRMTLFLAPMVAFCMGVWGDRIYESVIKSRVTKTTVLVLLFLPSAFSAIFFFYERFDDAYWQKPMTDWMQSAALHSDVLIATNDMLNPEGITPLPLLACKLVGVSELKGDQFPDYVIVSGPGRNVWEALPQSRKYSSILDLRGVSESPLVSKLYRTVRYNAATIYARSH